MVFNQRQTMMAFQMFLNCSFGHSSPPLWLRQMQSDSIWTNGHKWPSVVLNCMWIVWYLSRSFEKFPVFFFLISKQCLIINHRMSYPSDLMDKFSAICQLLFSSVRAAWIDWYTQAFQITQLQFWWETLHSYSAFFDLGVLASILVTFSVWALPWQFH